MYYQIFAKINYSFAKHQTLPPMILVINNTMDDATAFRQAARTNAPRLTAEARRKRFEELAH